MPFVIDKIDAELAGISVKAVTKDGKTTRRCRIKFRREFDDTIAAALGQGAKKIRSEVTSGGCSSAVLPIDKVVVSTTLTADNDDTAKIETAVGIKATCKASRVPTQGEPTPPMIVLEFEFRFDSDVWTFAGKNCGAVASISFKATQVTFDDALVGLGRRKIQAAESPSVGQAAS